MGTSNVAIPITGCNETAYDAVKRVMASIIFVSTAILAIPLGLLLLWRPQITDWLYENTTVRTAHFYERLELKIKWERRERDLRFLRIGVPGFLILWALITLSVVATR